MLKKILFLLLVMATTAMPAFAETAKPKDITKPPHFGLTGSVGNNSAIAMQCSGEAPFQEIDCSFTQVMISATSTKDLADQKAEAAKEFEKIPQKDIQDLKKELSSADLEKFKNRMKKATPEQQGYAQDLLTMLNAISASKNKVSLKKALMDQQDMEGATCSINLNTFELHFTRISKNKWLYNPGPTGMCNVVRVSTLENLEEHPNLWTYTQTNVTADKDPECQNWVEVGATMVTSWDLPKALKFEQCRYIQFGY